MKQHKWHKDEALKMAIKALEHYCFIESDRNEALIACKKALEPQPKEPQYLYAFLLEVGTKKGDIVFGLNNSHIDGFSYIGKIKLEEEE